MTPDTRLLIENLYFKELLNEEIQFFEQYESLLGERTKDFFGRNMGLMFILWILMKTVSMV